MNTVIMIDTNIIISAALNPSGMAAQAMMKALVPPFRPIVCDYIVDELHRKFEEKFPHRLVELEAFLYNALLIIEKVPTPEMPDVSEKRIRDIKDRPILRAALSAGAKYLLTGDKDFLESGITSPKIVNPASFILL